MKVPTWLAGILPGGKALPPSTSAMVGYDGQSYARVVYSNSRVSDGSKSHGSLSGSGRAIIFDHATIRTNARSAYFDSPVARGICDRYTDTTVGVGLKMKPTPIARLLGISSEEAEAWGADVQARFELWFASKDPHRAKNMTGYQLQRLYALSQRRDGEVFARCYYDGKGRSNPFNVELLDPAQIVGDGFTDTSGLTKYPADGIKRGTNGEELEYQVYPGAGFASGEPVTVPARTANGRPLMLHGFSQEYPGQTRGYSMLAHALDDFQKLGDFTHATLIKAINQASIYASVEPATDAPASNIFESISAGNAGPRVIADPVSEAEPCNGTASAITCTSVPEATLTSPGVMVMSLQAGEKLKPFANTAPADSYDKFVDAFTAYITASCNMPVEVYLQRFNANYSASRAALLLFWHVACIWRRELDDDFMTPVYETWLSEEIAAGRISAPGWSDLNLRRAWLAHSLIGTPVPNIDPGKLISAHKEQASVGAVTLDQIAHETNGSNGASNRAQLAREYAELPVPYWEAQASAKKPPVKDDEEDD